MFTSRTSVGVQERSASSSTVFVSEDTLCCCAWRRLDSRRDSICSWQARKQSCRRVQWKGRERPKSPLERSQAKIPVSRQSKKMFPGYLEWRVGRAAAPNRVDEKSHFFAHCTLHCCFSACAVYSPVQAHCSQLWLLPFPQESFSSRVW